jgi:thioredoxin reductase
VSGERVDVVVVGGGPAGLSAALILGRMRRRVILCDTDAPANAVSDAMHGFLSQDGTPPVEVRRVAAEQLKPYATVEQRLLAARSAREAPGGFAVTLGDGSEVSARRLLLAHGLHYGLPDLDGVVELWGERVFHCPYCHGWEVRDQPIAVYGGGSKPAHLALLLSALSNDIALLRDGAGCSDIEQRDRIAAAEIKVIEDRVERVVPANGGLRVGFGSGRRPLDRHALFVKPDLTPASDLAASLGVALTDAGTIETDETGLSSVEGVYAAGDAGAAVQSVAVATGSGARAAYAINADLTMTGTAMAVSDN